MACNQHGWTNLTDQSRPCMSCIELGLLYALFTLFQLFSVLYYKCIFLHFRKHILNYSNHLCGVNFMFCIHLRCLKADLSLANAIGGQ